MAASRLVPTQGLVDLQPHPAQLASCTSDGTRSGIIELHVAGSVSSGDTKIVGLEAGTNCQLAQPRECCPIG